VKEENPALIFSRLQLARRDLQRASPSAHEGGKESLVAFLSSRRSRSNSSPRRWMTGNANAWKRSEPAQVGYFFKCAIGAASAVRLTGILWYLFPVSIETAYVSIETA